MMFKLDNKMMFKFDNKKELTGLNIFLNNLLSKLK